MNSPVKKEKAIPADWPLKGLIGLGPAVLGKGLHSRLESELALLPDKTPEAANIAGPATGGDVEPVVPEPVWGLTEVAVHPVRPIGTPEAPVRPEEPVVADENPNQASTTAASQHQE